MNTLQKTIIIILVVILIMGLIIGGFFLYQNKTFSKNDPNEVLLKYVEALSNKNYEKMYEYLTNESKKLISKEDFISRNKNIYEGIEAKNIGATVLSNSKQEEGKEELVLTFNNSMDTIAGNVNFMNSLKMKNVDGKYKIVWDSSAIFSELKNEYKVRVSNIKSTRGRNI